MVMSVIQRPRNIAQTTFCDTGWSVVVGALGLVVTIACGADATVGNVGSGAGGRSTAATTGTAGSANATTSTTSTTTSSGPGSPTGSSTGGGGGSGTTSSTGGAAGSGVGGGSAGTIVDAGRDARDATVVPRDATTGDVYVADRAANAPGILIHVDNECPFDLWIRGTGSGATLQPDNRQLKTGETQDYIAPDNWSAVRV